MKSEKLSIVIPCYNNKLHVNMAVDSALAQTYPNKEVIVVDDGSNSETKKTLLALKHKIDQLIIQPNEGVSAARNTGIKAATGRYILVLDADDYFEPTFSDKAIKVFKEKKNIRLVTCYANWFRNKDDFKIFKPLGGNIEDFLFESRALGNSVFLKSDWKSIGGYDEKMLKGWEDWEFFIRLHKLGGTTYVIPDVLFNYRRQEYSKTTVANKNKIELMQYIYLKHKNLYKDNFDKILFFLLKKIENAENQKTKIKNSLDYKIGTCLLSPLRRFKSIFRNEL